MSAKGFTCRTCNDISLTVINSAERCFVKRDCLCFDKRKMLCTWPLRVTLLLGDLFESEQVLAARNIYGMNYILKVMHTKYNCYDEG